VECFRTSSSFLNHRISPLTRKYEPPRLSLFELCLYFAWLVPDLLGRGPSAPVFVEPHAPLPRLVSQEMSRTPSTRQTGRCKRHSCEQRSTSACPNAPTGSRWLDQSNQFPWNTSPFYLGLEDGRVRMALRRCGLPRLHTFQSRAVDRLSHANRIQSKNACLKHSSLFKVNVIHRCPLPCRFGLCLSPSHSRATMHRRHSWG